MEIDRPPDKMIQITLVGHWMLPAALRLCFLAMCFMFNCIFLLFWLTCTEGFSTNLQNGALRVVGAHRWGRDNSSERHPNEEVGSHDINLKTSKSVHICTTPPAHNYNQLIVSTVAKAVFEQQQAENPINAVGAGTFLTYNKDVLHSDFLVICCMLKCLIV